MEEGLFRQQAINNAYERLHGDVLVKPSFSHSLVIGFLVIWVLLILFWAFNSRFALRETVQGWVETPDGIVRVYAKNSGVITSILVAEGDKVTEGQPLLLVSSIKTMANGDLLEDKLLSEYRAQGVILDDQLSSSSRIYQQKRANLDKQIASLELSLSLLEKQNKTQNQIFSITTSQLERYEALKEEGYVSVLDVDNLVSKKLTLENDLQSNLIQRVTLTNQIEQLKSERALLSEDKQNEIGNYKKLLSYNDQQISQLRSQKTYLIKASKAGTISNLQVKQGQQVVANQSVPLLSLAPETNRLLIHLLVPIRSSGFVSEGQDLSVRYDAFPYQKFGMSTGKITQLSKATLLPSEVLNAPITVNEPVYRVTASMDKTYVEAYGRQIQLKPGMTLSADITLDQRSVMEWLLAPVYSLKGRLR